MSTRWAHGRKDKVVEEIGPGYDEMDIRLTSFFVQFRMKCAKIALCLFQRDQNGLPMSVGNNRWCA